MKKPHVKIKNIKNLKRKLIKFGACEESIDWVGDRDLKRALKDCKNVCWIDYLLDRVKKHNVVYKYAQNKHNIFVNSFRISYGEHRNVIYVPQNNANRIKDKLWLKATRIYKSCIEVVD